MAKCLDHAASKNREQIVPSSPARSTTSKRMKEKRAVLDGVAAELRRIIGEPVQHRENRNASCRLISVTKVSSKFQPGQLDKLSGLFFDA